MAMTRMVHGNDSHGTGMTPEFNFHSLAVDADEAPDGRYYWDAVDENGGVLALSLLHHTREGCEDSARLFGFEREPLRVVRAEELQPGERMLMNGQWFHIASVQPSEVLDCHRHITFDETPQRPGTHYSDEMLVCVSDQEWSAEWQTQG